MLEKNGVYKKLILLLVVMMFMSSKVIASKRFYLFDRNDPDLAIIILNSFGGRVACLVCIETATNLINPDMYAIERTYTRAKNNKGRISRQLFAYRIDSYKTAPIAGLTIKKSDRFTSSYANWNSVVRVLKEKNRSKLSRENFIEFEGRLYGVTSLNTRAAYHRINADSDSFFYEIGPYTGELGHNSVVPLGTPAANAILDSFGLQHYQFDGVTMIPVLSHAAAAIDRLQDRIGVPLPGLNLANAAVQVQISPGIGAGFPLPPGGNPDDFNPHLQQALMPDPHNNQGRGAVGLRNRTDSWVNDMSDPGDEPSPSRFKDVFD